MRDLLKDTAYLGLGLAVSISDSAKANLNKLEAQAAPYTKKGEERLKQFSERFTFTLPSDFTLHTNDLIADIQY